MNDREKERRTGIIVALADALGIDIQSLEVFVVPHGKSKKMVTEDNSIEVRVDDLYTNPEVYIKSPRSPAIQIDLVDPLKDELIPEGAIFRISAYIPDGANSGTALNNDVASVFIGPNGLIIDQAGRKRVHKLSVDQPKYVREDQP